MTKVKLTYPDSPGRNFTMWAHLVRMVILYYGNERGVEITLNPDPDARVPRWIIQDADFFFSGLLEMTCTVLSCLHRYADNRITPTSKSIMEKIKILILNEPENLNGVTWWRMYRPMQMLEEMYRDQVELIWNRGTILPIDIQRAHVAIAWRPSTPAQLGVIAHMHNIGLKIIVDHDDDILNVPYGSPAFGAYCDAGPTIKHILSLADMVWTSTEQIKESLGHKNTSVIPNAILPEDIPASPNPITKTVLWRGDFNQYEDVYASMDVYYRIARKCERFIWAGYMPTWEHPDNAEFFRWSSLGNYFQAIQAIKPNFIWKPMRKKLAFNLGKSNIAKLEALVSGGVALTNFFDLPTWEHSFREITWKQEDIHGAWESCRDQVLSEFNLESWTHERYKLIYSLL